MSRRPLLLLLVPLVASAALLATVDCGDPIAGDLTPDPDATTSDTTVINPDAGGGAADADAAISIACPPDAAFCESFDDTNFDARWDPPTPVIVGDGSTFELDDAAQTPPYALRVRLPAAIDGGERRVMLVKAVKKANKLSCAVSIKVVQTTNDNDVIGMSWSNGGHVWIDSRLSDSYLNVEPTIEHSSKPPLSATQWTRVEIAMTFQHVTVRYDNAVVYDHDNDTSAATEQEIELDLGVFTVEPGAVDVLYDDLVCTTE